jgi:hypothetical protein
MELPPPPPHVAPMFLLSLLLIFQKASKNVCGFSPGTLMNPLPQTQKDQKYNHG